MKTVISLLVVWLSFRMLPAVKLYDNPFLEGHEVNNVCFNRLLPAELDAFKLTVSQVPPEQSFCISAVVTQFSGA
jgi:hypothetical protein